MVDWFLGTIGFTYPEWKETFYPVGLPAAQSLNYYARIFNALEVNTTFYRPQSPDQIRRWSASTPENFRFCLKAPRRVTHDQRLVNTSAEMRAFLDSPAGLGDKLGVVLIQLPPSFTRDERPNLKGFLQTLPPTPRCAIEFRHASWHVPETAALLREYQVCWVANDYEDLPVEIVPTTDFLYLRWIAKHNVLPHPGHEVVDREERLRAWLERIRLNLDGIQAIYGFFDNDFAGHAPSSCNRFKMLAGLPVTQPLAQEQGRLF